MNNTRDDGAKAIITKYLNRMRFIEVTWAIHAWRDNIYNSEQAAKLNAIMAERQILETLRERAYRAETELRRMKKEYRDEKGLRTSLEQELDDIDVSTGGGGFYIQVKEVAHAVYKAFQIAARYEKKEAHLFVNGQDKAIALKFAKNVKEALAESRLMLHDLEEQVKRGIFCFTNL